MFLVELFAHPVGRLMTLVLLHFFWQGLAILLVLLAIVELCAVRRATARYTLSLVALVVMALCPVATLVWLSLGREMPLQAGPLDASLGVAESRSFELWRGGTFTTASLSSWLIAAQPYILAAWAIGVTLVGGRLLVGVVGVSRLRRGRMPIPLEMARVVERLGVRLRMKSRSLVFLSQQVAEAMAVGFVRPFVLIPASWASEMPVKMLEAIVAHELAHLRRRDLWVNLLQRIMESLLFYHPAVWWLSQRLRIERELCADELAVTATGQRLAYVQALEQIAQRRRAGVRPALAAFLQGEANMRLLERVRNVLGLSVNERSRLWPAGLIAVVLPLGLWTMSIGLPSATADDEREDDKPTAKRKVELIERQILDEQDADRSQDKRNVERDKVERKPKKVDDKNNFKPDPDNEIRKRTLEEGELPKATMKRKILRDDADAEPIKVLKKRPVDNEERVIDELVATVKLLSARVEKLQAEVAELRREEPREGREKKPNRYQYDRKPKPTAEQNDDDVRYRERLEAAEKQARAQESNALRTKKLEEQKRQEYEEIRATIEKQKADEKTLEFELKKVAEARDATSKAIEQERVQKEKAKAKLDEAVRQKLDKLDESKVKEPETGNNRP